MAKAVLADAESVMLPRWASGDIEIESSPLSIATSQLEVSLLGGAVRADAVLHGVVDGVELSSLCVEVRVHHAVDSTKRAVLSQHGVDVIEIDLSGLDEGAVSDPLAFRRHVLEDANNRHWINLATARYVAEGAETALFEVEDVSLTERVITTKAGRPFTIREQWAYLVKPGSREPVRLQIPDETVGEKALPYPRGLHAISARSLTVDQWGRLRLRYKIYLDHIEMNPPDTEDKQVGLFDHQSTIGGPGFRVRPRDWKGLPGR
ncbi:single-stranded DNA-binding protein [Lysobacter zhanggongensis]|uniref:Single-stranded DNA-binding protein n=1 Tax=Lysobacter zhanggongensis TaxID=1774951 RepID=A0ABU7YNK2_9GAMM